MIFSLNGVFVEKNAAKVPILDEAFLGGISVYETLRTYNGNLWQLDKHLKRLMASASTLLIKSKFSVSEIEKFVFEALKKANFLNARVRITLTKGGSDIYGDNSDSLLIIFVSEIKKTVTDFANLVLFEAERSFPEVKSGNFLVSYLAREFAKQNQVDDALLFKNNFVTETSVSNIFFVDQNKLITPSKNILFGITRAEIIELALSEKIEVVEQEVSLKDLSLFRECFTSNSICGVVPVKKIFSQQMENIANFNHSENGITSKLKTLFEKKTQSF